jgi:hypothetical protein
MSDEVACILTFEDMFRLHYLSSRSWCCRIRGARLAWGLQLSCLHTSAAHIGCAVSKIVYERSCMTQLLLQVDLRKFIVDETEDVVHKYVSLWFDQLVTQ